MQGVNGRPKMAWAADSSNPCATQQSVITLIQ